MGSLRLAGAALANREKPAPERPLDWEGEKASPQAKGPGFGKPVPKLKDRFPTNKDKVEERKE